MMPPVKPATAKTGGVRPGRGRLKDWVNWSTVLGAVAGVLIGLWAAKTRSLLSDEKDVLLAVLGASVGVLAVALTAMTLVIVFLTDSILGRVIRDLNVRRFFRPFVAVAVISAAAAIVSLVGAIDSATKAERPRDILFGLSTGLLTWAILGAARLVFTLVKWASTRDTMKTTVSDGDQATKQQLVEIRQVLTKLLEAVERRGRWR